MSAEIAVATVQGKAYYLIVNELKKRNIQFLSLTPTELIPVEIETVMTTDKEKHLINHKNVLVYKEGDDLEAMINSALQTAHGKRYYEKLTIGIDPGKVLGFAVIADGKVVEAENCFKVEEAIEKIKRVLKNLSDATTTSTTVKIGNGVPAIKEDLMRALDETLPQNVVLESVEEAGTTRYINEAKHRRELKDIASAIRIAGRNGSAFQRRKPYESNS